MKRVGDGKCKLDEHADRKLNDSEFRRGAAIRAPMEAGLAVNKLSNSSPETDATFRAQQRGLLLPQYKKTARRDNLRRAVWC